MVELFSNELALFWCRSVWKNFVELENGAFLENSYGVCCHNKLGLSLKIHMLCVVIINWGFP